MSTLFVLMSAIVANRDLEVTVNDYGAILSPNPDDGRLPFLEVTTFAQLRRNGLISVRREGSEFAIGLGERTRQIASRWGIELPEA